MKRIAVLALALSLTLGTLFAQTANVIELAPNDVTRAQKAWDALQKAQAEWASIEKSVGKQYALVLIDDPSAGTVLDGRSFSKYYTVCADGTQACLSEKEKRERKEEESRRRYFRKDFENGFVFSKDFKFIVPKAGATSGTITIGTPNYWNCGSTVVPAFNTINDGRTIIQ